MPSSPFRALVLDYLTQLGDLLADVADEVRGCDASGPVCRDWLERLTECHGHLEQVRRDVGSGYAEQDDPDGDCEARRE